MYKKTHGFTIIELLIVIVIIAILAAITLVSYNGLTNRSKMSKMQSDYDAIQKAVALYRVDNADPPFCPAGAGQDCKLSDVVSSFTVVGLPTKTNNSEDILWYADPTDATTGDRWGVRMTLPDKSHCMMGVNKWPSWWKESGKNIPSCW